MMETLIEEPEMMKKPSDGNAREWEDYAVQEFRDLGVLEEADKWIESIRIPQYWLYGKYAYAYHAAPLWLMGNSEKKEKFFYA